MDTLRTSADDDRVLLLPRGGGGAAVGFEWSGERLAHPKTYTGRSGETP